MNTTPTQPESRPLDAIILAAGKGTRMNSDRAKVLLEAADHPLAWWVARACREAGARRIILVIGYDRENVRAAFADQRDIAFVVQDEQLGTGHAAKMAQPLFDGQSDRDVLVMAGDAPLIDGQTLGQLVATHRESGAAATLATALLDDPSGYGRVLREADGSFARIVEQKDASDKELAVREINASYYCFKSKLLFETLAQVRNDNNQGEYYLPDVPKLLKARGHKVQVVDAVPAEQVVGANTPEQLAVVDRILRKRVGTAQQVQ